MSASGLCAVEVDGAAAADLSALLDGAFPGAVPVPDVPIVYGMRLAADAARRAGLSMAGAATTDELWLHEAQSIACARPLRAGQQLAARYDATQRGPETTFAMTVADDRGALMELTTRLRRGGAALLAAARTSGAAARAPRAGMTSLLSGPLTGEMVGAYAELSGDDNPLHLDVALARSLGFPERIVHGMLVAGMVEPVLRAAGFGRRASELRVRFLAPVYVGERVRLWVAGQQPAGDGVRARVMVAVEGGPLACVADARAVA